MASAGSCARGKILQKSWSPYHREFPGQRFSRHAEVAFRASARFPARDTIVLERAQGQPLRAARSRRNVRFSDCTSSTSEELD
jgi:hypothetical protein